MSIEEQQALKQKNYAEAQRYMDNAKATLQNAGREYNYYIDAKYVKTACGTAYNGVLIALDTYLQLKGIKKTRGRKAIEYYQEKVSLLDKKLLKSVNEAYKVLHLSGYYDGIQNATIIKIGFDEAYTIIDQIKPA